MNIFQPDCVRFHHCNIFTASIVLAHRRLSAIDRRRLSNKYLLQNQMTTARFIYVAQCSAQLGQQPCTVGRYGIMVQGEFLIQKHSHLSSQRKGEVAYVVMHGRGRKTGYYSTVQYLYETNYVDVVIHSSMSFMYSFRSTLNIHIRDT